MQGFGLGYWTASHLLLVSVHELRGKESSVHVYFRLVSERVRAGPLRLHRSHGVDGGAGGYYVVYGLYDVVVYGLSEEESLVESERCRGLDVG